MATFGTIGRRTVIVGAAAGAAGLMFGIARGQSTRSAPGSLRGKTALVTGSTDGLGREVATRLGALDATVIVHGRNRERGAEVVEVIKAETGMTVVAYVRHRRLARAEHLLRESTLSIPAVAASIGIPNLQAFNKACRQELGSSPRAIRDTANKEIEDVRSRGQVGSSLQAEVIIRADAADRALLESLGEDLKFVMITSKATIEPADALSVGAVPSTAVKCERCWHWRDDVGHDPAHPTLCGRCTSNLYGEGERRTVA